MGLLRFVFLITIVSVSCKPVDFKNIRIEEPPPIVVEEQVKVVNSTEVFRNEVIDSAGRNQIRPGMVANGYLVELTPNIGARTFSGVARMNVTINEVDTRDDPIKFYAANLNINSVTFTIFGGTTQHEASFQWDDDTILEIETDVGAVSYTFTIEYTADMTAPGKGFYVGQYDDSTYVGMNLHPTYARHVFPCMDEPDVLASTTFTFNNLDYTHIVSNSMLQENSANQFRPLQGPLHLWGMIAHNFVNVNNIPNTNVMLYGRPGLANQVSQASIAINSISNNLLEWTGKTYQDIVVDQDGSMNIIALPDVSTEWNSLSIVGIWEPYVYMEPSHSIKQRKTSLVKIAEGMSRQYFGYVIFPENWQFEWVVSGLSTYMAYEMMRQFQDDVTDVNQLDINTIFVTDVIQESLLLDAYPSARVLEPQQMLLDEDVIRDHLQGVLKYKAPALMRMMRLVLGDQNTDFMRIAASALLNRAPLQPVNSLGFVGAVNSEFLGNNNGNVGDIEEYLEPWILNNGYPLVRVDLRPGVGVFLSQERFGFANQPHINFEIPITYTTSSELNFGDNRIYPVEMMDNSLTVPMSLGEEDWVLFNIQGQGYYRVNYDETLWERIIEALQEPEIRNRIHPLNRATLVDDALNVARRGILDYEIAFNVVLTMEHETEYAVWKAFVRNMEFLRKRLVALVDDDEDLDPDIYLRMVRRTVGSVESELKFYPDINLSESVMVSLTRGLVMDHACRANYRPCIAAAVDLFYDPNNNGVVNPDIPHDIRPAVYCTMVREGGEDVRQALLNRLEIEPTHYERVVILESLGCSQDENFIRGYLADTVDPNSPYVTEERVKIFSAVAESSLSNAILAYQLISQRTGDVRRMYGGPEKLEEVIFVLADNVVGEDFIRFFREWVTSTQNTLEDSEMAALRAFEQVTQNEVWERTQMMDVYEWIDENHAPTLVLSVTALIVSLMVALFNN